MTSVEAPRSSIRCVNVCVLYAYDLIIFDICGLGALIGHSGHFTGHYRTLPDIPDTLSGHDRTASPDTFRTGPDTFRTGPDTFRTGPCVAMSSFKSDTPDTPDTPDTAIGQSDDSSRIFCRMPFWSEVKLTIQSKGTLLMIMMGDFVI